MTTSIESIDAATSRVLVGGVEAFRFTAAGINKVAPGVITAAMLAAGVVPLGVGQTRQNLTASRAVNGTNYTNSTGRPIWVVVNTQNSATATASMKLNGADIATEGRAAGLAVTFYALLLDGEYVSVSWNTGTPSLISWYEYR